MPRIISRVLSIQTDGNPMKSIGDSVRLIEKGGGRITGVIFSYIDSPAKKVRKPVKQTVPADGNTGAGT